MSVHWEGKLLDGQLRVEAMRKGRELRNSLELAARMTWFIVRMGVFMYAVWFWAGIIFGGHR